MNFLKIDFLLLLLALIGFACNEPIEYNNAFNADNMMIRISEIEIAPEHLDEYIAILKKESEASVRLEAGVISIYPMYQKEKPNEIRILEIYKDKAAYESHLQTPHFKHYKTTTLNMVKSLKLIDMKAIDEETMPQIFKKLSENK